MGFEPTVPLRARLIWFGRGDWILTSDIMLSNQLPQGRRDRVGLELIGIQIDLAGPMGGHLYDGLGLA